MSNSEIWEDVVGYEGLYQVSSKGNVRSLDRTRYVSFKQSSHTTRQGTETYNYKGKLLKPVYIESKLPPTVHLYDASGKRKAVLVKRLVADAFLFAVDISTRRIKHRDNDVTNCKACNLYIMEENQDGKVYF